MEIYFGIIVFPVLFSIARPKQKRFVILLSLGVLFFVSTFRAETIGTDYSGYVYYFYRIAETGTAYFHERGFILLNILASKLGTQYWIIAAFVNLMLFIPLFFMLDHLSQKSKQWIFALLVFLLNPYLYLQTTFNAMRQCCAIGPILLAVPFLRKKKYVPYCLLILLASLFHRIAFVLLLLPLVMLIKWNRKKWTITACVSLALSFGFTQRIAAIVIDILRFKSNYDTYQSSLLNNFAYILFIFVYIVILLSIYEGITSKDLTTKWYMDLYLLSLIALFFGVKNDMVYRARIIFSFMSLPALPLIFDQLETLNGKNFLSQQNNKTVFVWGHLVYYLCFWGGYIFYLAYRKDTFYVPFQFCF